MAVKLSPREKAALATQAMNKPFVPVSSPSTEVPVRHANSVQIGLSMAGQGGKVKELEKELQDANSALKSLNAQWQGVLPSKLLNPQVIKPSRWANRDAQSFDGPEFSALKAEIASAGGNVQPIKVRPIPGSDPQEFEVVFGHRRHRACLELGLDVLAVIESIDDKALFKEMDRENRLREDLRPYEQGVMYKRAIDEKLFSNVNQMATDLGVDVSNVRKAIAMAELPTEVLDAFESRLDIQFAWAKKLRDALSADADAVLKRARLLLRERAALAKISSVDAFARLLATPPSKEAAPRLIKVGDKSFTVAEKGGRVAMQIQGLDKDRLAKLERFLKELLSA